MTSILIDNLNWPIWISCFVFWKKKEVISSHWWSPVDISRCHHFQMTIRVRTWHPSNLPKLRSKVKKKKTPVPYIAIFDRWNVTGAGRAYHLNIVPSFWYLSTYPISPSSHTYLAIDWSKWWKITKTAPNWS